MKTHNSGRRRCRQEDNINMDLREIGSEGVHRVQMA